MLGTHEHEYLLTEPIVAWKALNATWGFGSHDRQGFTSPSKRSFWHDGQLSWDEVCHCGHTPRALDYLLYGDRPAPVECHCGINAYAKFADLLTSPYCAHGKESADIVARVQLTGRVRRYERGWRAEHARVDAAWYRYARDLSSQGWLEGYCARQGVVYGGSFNHLMKRLNEIDPDAHLGHCLTEDKEGFFPGEGSPKIEQTLLASPRELLDLELVTPVRENVQLVVHRTRN